MTPLQMIASERKRQVEVEGYSSAHDDGHDNGELLRAAVLYYSNTKRQPSDPPLTLKSDGSPVGWPWEAACWKPRGPELDLIRSGALCCAERDRLRRISGSYRGHVEQKLGLIVKALRALKAA